MNKIFSLTAEELLELEETKRLLLSDYSNDDYEIKKKVELDIAKTIRYKDGFYFHATSRTGECGIGQGLYLDKDKIATNNFYNCDNFGYIETYFGFPSFLDLALYSDFDKFKESSRIKYPNEKFRNHFKLMTLSMGYDGIRYFDPFTTGEEFVLYNIEKVKLIGRPRKKVLFQL